MITLEKKALTELLKLYKELPCLWDQQHLLYSNKEARSQAYSVLLGKYRSVQEDATLDGLKKKIENMRTAFRREQKKVSTSRANGELEYRPTLSYYDLLTFLNNISDDKNSVDSTEFEDNEAVRLECDYGYDFEEPKPKKQKYSRVLFPEPVNSESNNKDDDLSLNSLSIESLAFGKTIGLQLKDLDSFQRIVAEKLISDVIFYARLNKLTTTTSLNFK